MSDFTKSIVYSGFVLVAGLIAVFAISSNMTAPTGDTGSAFAVIEPAAGNETATDTMDTMTDKTSTVETGVTDEDLAKLRAALEEAGISVSEIEPAAGEETNVMVDTAPAE
ncbi:MAG: hypothetical protein AAF182_03805 [Pseudomonadota bacterium]